MVTVSRARKRQRRFAANSESLSVSVSFLIESYLHFSTNYRIISVQISIVRDFPRVFKKRRDSVLMSPTSSYTVRLLFTRPVDGQNNAIVRALKLITFVKEKLLFPSWGLHKEWSYQIWETKATSQRFFYDEGSWSISSKIPPSLYCDHTHLQPGKHLMRSPCYFYGGSFLFETAINKNYKCQVLHGACALFHRKRHTPHTNAAIIVHPSSEPRVFWRHERNGLAAYCHEAVRLKQQRRLGQSRILSYSVRLFRLT